MVTARWLDLFVEVERALCCVVVKQSGMVCIAVMYVTTRSSPPCQPAAVLSNPLLKHAPWGQ